MITDAFKLKSLSKRIIVNFSILILAILVFEQIATYYIIHGTVQNINNNYITVGLKQKNEKLNNFLNEVDSFSKTIVSDRDIQTLLIENKDANSKLSKIPHEISYALSNMIEAVFLISKNGVVYKEAENELDEYVNGNINQIKSKVTDSKGEMVFFNSNFLNYGSNLHGDYFFLVARKVRSIDTFEDIGIMVFAIRESLLWNNIIMDGELGDFYITSPDGSIISCKEKDYIGKNISGRLEKVTRKQNLVLSSNSYINNGLIINNLQNSMTGWNLINAVNINELNANYLNVQKVLIVIGVIAIVLAIYIAVIISGHITRPIRDLIFSMKKVMAGNLDVQMDIELVKGSTDELKELNGVFNKMTKELQSLVKKVYHESLREKESELRALKAQINPHFLYNTLDTVYWMLIEKSDYDIAELITKLGEILRYSIRKGSSNVSVKEEIQQVENYLFIQKSRFEDSLEYEFDIDKNIVDYEVPSFLIQPFVENAINHGIMRNKGHGKVTIIGYCANERIYFEITDDGTGMTEEQIRSIYNRKEDRKSSNGGIGVLNVHDRIKYYYGEEFGVNIESHEGLGTKITVMIPLIIPGGGRNEA